MGIHFTTVVVPAERSGTDTDNAVLIIAGEMLDDIPHLPLPVALHLMGNELGVYGPHGRVLGAPLPVSDIWGAAAAPTEGYVAQARVCVVLEPLPEEAGTHSSPLKVGVPEPGLASWLGPLIAGEFKMAFRAVRVSTGGPLMVDSALHAPTKLPEWADHIHTP